MSAMASQITSLTIVYSTVYSRRRSEKSSKLRVTGLVRGIHRWPVNSPHKWILTHAKNVSIWCRHHDRGHKNGLVRPIRSFCHHKCVILSSETNLVAELINGLTKSDKILLTLPPFFGFWFIEQFLCISKKQFGCRARRGTPQAWCSLPETIS